MAGDSPWKPGDHWRAWRPVPGRLPLKSVHACELEQWSLLTWPRESVDPATGELRAPSSGGPAFRPFLCGSWRCRRCARVRGASDYVRARDAILGRQWWLYVVLTFDPSRFASKWEAYRAAGGFWNDHLRQAMRRKGGRFAYLQTWEAHKSRWPHCNLLLTGDELRSWVEGLGVERRQHRSPISDRERSCVLPRGWRQWFKAAAVRAGFGPVCWVEAITPQNPDALAGYFIKLARELTGGVAAKGEQSPIDAPKNFRRLRASRGLLPRSTMRGDGTGAMTGSLRLFRCVDEPSPPRQSGESPKPREASWADVFGALEADARRIADKWANEAAEQRQVERELERDVSRWPTADAPLDVDSLR